MAENTVNPVAEEELSGEKLNEVLRIRREKLDALVAAGKDPFKITKYDRTHHSSDIRENFEKLEGKEVSVAGRLMSKRIMGKASFCNVQDLKGNIQCYVARDAVGEEEYAAFKKLDIGDIVGIKGTVFKTKTGEISIHATEVSRTYKYRFALPSEICRPYSQSRGARYVYQALKDNQHDKTIP